MTRHVKTRAAAGVWQNWASSMRGRPEDMNPMISENQTEVAKLCREFHVQRLDIFGSAAGVTFELERSDLDFLVEFETLPLTLMPPPFSALRRHWNSSSGGLL